MKRKTYGAVALALLAGLPLIGCGNSLEDGSSPSGSVIRIVSMVPNSGSNDAFTPDIFLTECDRTEDADGNVIINYEPGIHNNWVDVALRNDSRPNTPSGSSTNSFVTFDRYRVDFVGVSQTVSIPSINGSATLGLAPDQQRSLTVLIMGLETLEYIRDNNQRVGHTDTLTLRVQAHNEAYTSGRRSAKRSLAAVTCLSSAATGSISATAT